MPHSPRSALVSTLLLAYSAFGVLLNAVSRSRWERWPLTPRCSVRATATLIVAVG